MLISKSDYMLFLRHPAWLWLKKHDSKKLPPVDAGTQALFDSGHRFEQYAEQLYPNGVRLGFNNYNEYLTLPERTASTLADGAKTIFQGRFEFNQITFICDIVDIVGEKLVDLIEIKSSTSVKDEHEFDLAFQMVVLEGCGFTVRNIFVIHVNSDYVRNGEIDPKAITKTSEITEAVKAKREYTKEQIEQALKVVNSDKCPDLSPSLVQLGSVGDWLNVYRGLADIQPLSIYDLCSVSAQTIGELEKVGVKLIVDIPNVFKLNFKQSLQVRATKQGRAIINIDTIKQFLDELIFPLYFFDYETLSSSVPYFDGMRPYKQYPFQYSLHILDAPDSALRHMGYLHKDNCDPAEMLSKILKAQIGESGSVVTWNMGFEKGCNELIGSRLPEYTEFYKMLNNRIVDLMTPFSTGLYVDKDFKGSASIKNVLPVLVPELSYKNLGIQEGGSDNFFRTRCYYFGGIMNVYKVGWVHEGHAHGGGANAEGDIESTWETGMAYAGWGRLHYMNGLLSVLGFLGQKDSNLPGSTGSFTDPMTGATTGTYKYS
jgi:hypothetical protein